VSKATDEEITHYLIQDEFSRFIVVLCKTGMPADKIFIEVKRNRAQKGFSVDDDNIRSTTSSRLQSMEKLGILVYENQAWKTTDKVREILRKYFGMV